MLYYFIWVILCLLHVMFRRFGTPCSVLVGRVNRKNNRDDIAGVFIGLNVLSKRRLGQSEGGVTGRRRFRVEEQAMEGKTPKLFFLFPGPMKMEQSVPKRRNIKFRTRGITQGKEYNRLFLAYICTPILEYQMNTDKCAGMLLVCAIC
jgi:hypothetical protein